MSSTSLDLSGSTDLDWVADLARPVLEAAAGARIFVVGAMARELVLVHGYGVHPGRATRDLDFAVRVADWEEYESIRARLIEEHGFTADPGIAHRLQSPSGAKVDLLPFGAVEKQDRTIAWPPGDGEVMSTLGFAETADAGIEVLLPGKVRMDVASPAGQALLKIVVWSDRHDTRPGSDAHDLTLLLRKYLDAGNESRLYDEAEGLLDAPDFDREVAGVHLLGRDIAGLLDATGVATIRAILEREIDPDGPLRLAGDLGCEIEQALRLLHGLDEGLQTSEPKISAT